eukprot:symbB.v1.2.006335.t1/scaffold378.1/size217351/13
MNSLMVVDELSKKRSSSSVGIAGEMNRQVSFQVLRSDQNLSVWDSEEESVEMNFQMHNAWQVLGERPSGLGRRRSSQGIPFGGITPEPTISEIQSANDRLNNSTGSNRLESDLVELFYPIYRAHAVEHRDEAVFTPHLGCPFLTFCFSEAEDGAAYIYFSEKFDEHVRLQEGKFLVQHDLSKQHGKLKGKRLRHAINWHNLTCAFSGADAVMWPTSVTRQSSQAAGLIGERMRAPAAVWYALFLQLPGALAVDLGDYDLDWGLSKEVGGARENMLRRNRSLRPHRAGRDLRVLAMKALPVSQSSVVRIGGRFHSDFLDNTVRLVARHNGAWAVGQSTVMFLVRTGRRAVRMPRRGHGQPIDMELLTNLAETT